MDFMTVAELRDATQQMALPVFLIFVGIVVLMADLVFDRDEEQGWTAYLSIAGLVGALFLWMQSWLAYYPPTIGSGFYELLNRLRLIPAPRLTDGTLLFGAYDPVGYLGINLIASLLIVVITLVVILLAPGYLERRGLQRGEYYALILFASAGLILMACSAHLILLFLGLELLSIPLYILAGFARPNLRSEESGLKYFLLGAFASGFLLYGIALAYGATGSMNLHEIRDLLTSARETFLLVGEGQTNWMAIAALALLLVGMGFKISLAPFHQWTPDVYEGAPTPVTAFMVAATKVGGFVALTNILIGFVVLSPWWTILLVGIAALTMVVGNVGALLQTNIKRMLAYSSIAHAGYMLVGLSALLDAPVVLLPALMLYLAVYALMNVGAFAVLIALEEGSGREVIELGDFAGLGRTHPILGLLLGFFLLSLAGFPPTAGFFAKFFLFTGAVLGDRTELVVAAVVLSVLSLFYYARFIVAMFMQPRPENAEGEAATLAEGEGDPVPPLRSAPSWMVRTVITVTALLVLGIGLFPNPLLNLLQRAQ